jgi:hypothetical protein
MATATMTTAAEAAVMVIETMTEDTAAVRIVEEDMMIAEVIIPEKVLFIHPKHILQVENNVLFLRSSEVAVLTRLRRPRRRICPTSRPLWWQR